VKIAVGSDHAAFEHKQYVVKELRKQGHNVLDLGAPSTESYDYPDAAKLPQGGSAALFFVITGVDAYHAAVSPNANVIMPLKTQFYGMSLRSPIRTPIPSRVRGSC
jgi:hypothetical protein